MKKPGPQILGYTHGASGGVTNESLMHATAIAPDAINLAF